MDDDYIEHIFKVNTNVHDMLIDRKYADLISGKFVQDLETFRREYVTAGTLDKESLNFVRVKGGTKLPEEDKHERPGKFISVLFTTEETIGIKYIHSISERMIASKIPHYVLVYPKSITPSAKKYIEKSSEVRIEAFAEEDLLINITKHFLMPIHQVLTETEKKQFLRRSRLSENQLARIHMTDPVARYYGMRRGQMARIIRRSDTAGKYPTYRICN